ncbi:MAG: hypothetical protein KDD45_09720 [Bdellovibrionales bacterium]|nr:hypothetical protein [Bdellovibrionales bacterium]
MNKTRKNQISKKIKKRKRIKKKSLKNKLKKIKPMIRINAFVAKLSLTHFGFYVAMKINAKGLAGTTLNVRGSKLSNKK